MKLIVSICAFFFVLFGAFHANANVDVESFIWGDSFVFTNSMGDVEFNHEAHKAFDDYGKCSNCHGSDKFPMKFDDDVSIMKKAHGICRDCHKEAGGAAPVGCNDCHQK